MNAATEMYRHFGALLSLSKEDADLLIAREVGIIDYMGNDPDRNLYGVRIPSFMIDRLEPGEPPHLFLVGRVDIIRDDNEGDRIAAIRPFNIDKIFDNQEND